MTVMVEARSARTRRSCGIAAYRRSTPGIPDRPSDPRPMIGVGHIRPEQPADIGIFLLPHMRPRPRAARLGHPAQPPVADRADIMRHRQRLAFELAHRRLGRAGLHREHQAAIDAVAQPRLVRAAADRCVDRAVDMRDRRIGRDGLSASVTVEDQVAAVEHPRQGRLDERRIADAAREGVAIGAGLQRDQRGEFSHCRASPHPRARRRSGARG